MSGILDAYGNPVKRVVGFITPKWVMADMAKRAEETRIERTIAELRESAGVQRTVISHSVGSPVRVRLPQRYASSMKATND